MPMKRDYKVKVCLVGEKAVGKTSLIRRYVLDTFEDHYLTTIGTKVSKKEISLHDPRRDLRLHLDMTIWDIMGEKGFRQLLKESYFYGANGILAVADVTRRRTLDDLDDWLDSAMRVTGHVPSAIVVSKTDLAKQAEFGEREVRQVARAFESTHLYASAKSGENVDGAFRLLAKEIADELLSEKADNRESIVSFSR